MMNKKNPIYIVTGATGSIGKEIALSLAKENKCVLIACRDLKRGKELQNQIIKETGNKEILLERLSLDSIKDVMDFISHLKSHERPIKALINNAGVMSRTHELSPDGLEKTFQVNYFSTAILTFNIMPMIENGGSVIFTTSLTHKLCRLRANKSLYERESHYLFNQSLKNNVSEEMILFCDSKTAFSQLGTYARSKRALTAFAVFLSKTELGNRIKINCADPGVVDSDMIRMSRWFDGIADVLARPFMSTPKKGALSALSALNAKESGYIYHNSATKKIISNNLIINKNIFPEDEKEFKPKSKNTEKEIIERLINISFSYFKNLSTQEN